MKIRILPQSLLFLGTLAIAPVTGLAQESPKVLFIGGGAQATSGADGAVWDRMTEWWGEDNVTYIQSGASATDDAEGMDVVVLSSTPGSGDIRNKFHELEIGVLNWEEALARQLSLGEMGITTGNRQKYTLTEISIEDNTHPITSGLPAGAFQLLENPAETWGSQWGLTLDSDDPLADELLAPGARILADIPVEAIDGAGFDFRNAALVAVEQGDSLWQDGGDAVPAPGRRVMFPMTDATANSLTEEGWNLLRRSIEWAAGTLPEGGDPNLIGWWKLTEGSSDVVNDASGRHDPAIIENAGNGGLGPDGSVWTDAEGDALPAFLSGQKVASFNGVDGSGAYIFLGDEVLPLMTEENAFTWAFWANSQQAPNNDIIFGNRYRVGNADFSPRQFIKFTTSNFEWDTNNVQGVPYEDIPQDVWMHHAVVKTGLEFTYYRDGEAFDTGFADAAPEFVMPLFIAGQGVENWAGMMADVAIFDRALTPEEIGTVFANGIQAIAGSGPDDTDGDGMPDSYEEANGLDINVNDANEDEDGDGISNLAEYNADPRTMAGKADTDGDGLRDNVETNTGVYVGPNDTGTNPTRADSDGDGLPDGVETNTGTFVNATNTGTNPLKADTDGDGFEDGREVTLGFNPLDANSRPTIPILGFDLLGGDLTDPEDDGDPEFEDGYDAEFASSEEEGFGGGELAFNVFDNILGPGNDKWCCGSEGGTFPQEPIWVQATFETPIVLTHFTVSSANDVPGRDPTVWEIQGSNDGGNFTTIFRQDDPGNPIWDARLQVAEFRAGTHYALPGAYSTIRFTCFETSLTTGARFQVGELEFFGDAGPTRPFLVEEVSRTVIDGKESLQITFPSVPGTTFTVETGTNLQDDWLEITDGLAADAGDATTYVLELSDPAPPVLYIRVRQE